MLDLVQDDVVKKFRKLSTSAISDALDKHGVEGACHGIAPLNNHFRTAVGRAFTVKYESCGVVKGTVGDFIDDVLPGSIVVIDNAGRTDCTVWGDILTTASVRKGIVATAINGVCRDVSLANDYQYPIYSKGKYMRTGKDRVQVEAVNVPVSFGTIRVNPGDIIAADADGLLVIPQEIELQVLQTAEEIEALELQIRVKVEQGMRLDEARQKFKYHTLQRG